MTARPTPGGGALARLVLLNGAPGTGKSTLAARYVTDRPLALNLDVDVVRSLLGAWTDTPGDAGTAARRLALAMTVSHLREGLDVVVPQFVAVPWFVDALASLADGRATFHHVVLHADPDAVWQRLSSRADPDGVRIPLDENAFHAYVDRLERFVAVRPEVVRLDADGNLDTMHASLRGLLG